MDVVQRIFLSNRPHPPPCGLAADSVLIASLINSQNPAGARSGLQREQFRGWGGCINPRWLYNCSTVSNIHISFLLHNTGSTQDSCPGREVLGGLADLIPSDPSLKRERLSTKGSCEQKRFHMLAGGWGTAEVKPRQAFTELDPGLERNSGYPGDQLGRFPFL